MNVLKVGQVLDHFEIQSVPKSNSLHRGIVFWRGLTVPILDLAPLFETSSPLRKPQLLILQILNHSVGILVGEVKQIRYTSWDSVSPVSHVSESGAAEMKYISAIASIEGDKPLPLLDFERIVMEQVIPTGADTGASKVSLSGLRILYAEDSGTVRFRVTRKLVSLGADVIAVKDGKEAWDILKSDTNLNIRLVITDVEMPRMDGFRLLKEISTTFPGRYLTMIYTSLSHEGLLSHATDVGADLVLTKYDDAQLAEAIARLTQNRAT